MRPRSGRGWAWRSRGDDIYDLPRIEMFYFRDERRWRDHLVGRGGAYLAARRALRWVRGRVAAPWAGL